MFSFRSSPLVPRIFATVPLLLLALYPKPGKELFIASSADDAALILRIKGLASTVSLEDARQVASCAFTTGLELRREWGVSGLATWLPGLHNLFIKMGAKKGGYCFQYSAQLLVRLQALKLQTVEFHWAESEVGTMSENNAIVVTARGQQFEKGIVLDNWRAQGHLAWTQVTKDPEYRWKEGKSFAAVVLRQASETNPGSKQGD